AQPVRFGLIGCGAISTQHVEAIRAVDGAALVAVASASEERARNAGERWGVAWTTDVATLLARDDVDAVAICTPSGLHAAEALTALRQGKHVVVEKPLALTVADAEAVIAEASRVGRIVATISQRRFEPVTLALREAVEAGAFGHVSLVIAEGIYYRPQSYYDSAAWRGTRAMDGGVLMNQAIHMVDLLRWIGGPVVSVAAHTATLGHEMEAEDAATVSLRFANGALGSIIATTCAEPGFAQELRVYGDRGHARLVGDVAAEWVTADGTPDPGAVGGAVADAAAAVTPDQLAPATWGTDATGHIRQYADIVAAIRDGRPPAITAEDGRDAVEIVTAAYESDRLGRAIAIGPMRAAAGASR
ncbi:MAG TPA: Gfo/Idh/MocA family oxidoreductase, partial [Candidatus Limnocylindrales bacterium]|nr:Gfo/Idh/MocA family oxidoreductase [Candidatus Limnocylindrales bacterium]